MGTWSDRVIRLRVIGGGGKRDRTADLLHAMQALSQLSYTPTANVKLYGRDVHIANECIGPVHIALVMLT